MVLFMEKDNPIISVVIQTRKTPLMILKRCIQCIKEQTLAGIEIILLDSNETESSYKEAIRQEQEFFSDMVYLEIPESKGFVKGKNAALKAFHGNYITFLSAQDMMPSTRLETLVNFLEENHSYHAVYTDMSVQQSNILESSDFHLTSGNPEYLAQLVFHRECFQWIGEFDSDLVAHIDKDIWLRLRSLHLTCHLSAPGTMISVCTDCYNRYTPLEAAIGYRQLETKYRAFFQKNPKLKKELFQKTAAEYKKAHVLHRYIQFQTKALFIRSGAQNDKPREASRTIHSSDANSL